MFGEGLPDANAAETGAVVALSLEVDGRTSQVESRGELTTVRFFEELYAIVVGLGLAVSVEQVLDTGTDGSLVEPRHLFLFLAYLNFAFPLAHASIRYLDLAYVDRAIPLGKPRVLGDLALGMGHFLWLIALAFLVTRPFAFVWIAVALLIGRPARDAIVLWTGGQTLAFDRSIGRVHLGCIAGLVAVGATGHLIGGDDGRWLIRIATVVIALGFALGHYLGAFDYFFPKRREREAG
jgi:hypothetical protein